MSEREFEGFMKSVSAAIRLEIPGYLCRSSAYVFSMPPVFHGL